MNRKNQQSDPNMIKRVRTLRVDENGFDRPVRDRPAPATGPTEITMNRREHIDREPAVLGGKPKLRGTRLRACPESMSLSCNG